MYKYVFFDLDGTLTDSQEGIINSIQNALKHFNIQRTNEDLKRFIGPSLYDTFQNHFNMDKPNADEAVKKFREYFTVKGIFENKVYNGIKELLETLKKNDFYLVVTTSKPEDFAIRILEHFEIAEYFNFICGSTMDETRTAKNEVIEYALKRCGFENIHSDINTEVIMVGDRTNDVEGAHKNNLKCIYVLYGYGNKDEAEKCNADWICNSVEELQTLLIKDTVDK